MSIDTTTGIINTYLVLCVVFNPTGFCCRLLVAIMVSIDALHAIEARLGPVDR